MERMLKNHGISVYGDGENLRDYVHVEDVVRANVAALHCGSEEFESITEILKINNDSNTC